MVSTGYFTRPSAVTSIATGSKKEQICCMYVISESGGCNLKSSTKLQIDYTPRQHRHETKEKE